jgi:hypothetical protein
MEFCLGLFIVLWIFGIIVQLVSNKSPASGYDEIDPFESEEDFYDDEIMLAIMLMEDDDRTDDETGW